MIARTIAVAFLFALAVAPPTSANHQDPLPPIPLGSIAVGLKPIADGLRGPDWLNYAPDQDNRRYVVEQTGTVRIIENGQRQAQPFLDISSRIAINPANPVEELG